MAKPPATPPSSDIEGVNRDARIGTPSNDPGQGSGEALRDGKAQSTARPEQSIVRSSTPHEPPAKGSDGA